MNYSGMCTQSKRPIRQLGRVFLLLLLAAPFVTSEPGTWSQEPIPTPPATTTAAAAQRPTSTPYTGDLSIFDTPDRDKKLQIEHVMDLLNIRAGSTVADIGAGSGWFTVRAAKRVGDPGTVYAVDINPEAVKYINDRIKKNGIQNVHTILSAPDDPKLPANSVDAVLILKTYHEIADPVRLLESLRKSLRPGARVGIIDRNGNGQDHGIEKSVVEQEAARARYHITGDYDFVKADREDYFLILQANP